MANLPIVLYNGEHEQVAISLAVAVAAFKPDMVIDVVSAAGNAQVIARCPYFMHETMSAFAAGYLAALADVTNSWMETNRGQN